MYDGVRFLRWKFSPGRQRLINFIKYFTFINIYYS
jgi:hypothetical protein